MMKTILVTGGTGFIGSHTSLALLEKGYKLLLIDSLVTEYFFIVCPEGLHLPSSDFSTSVRSE